MCLQLRLAALSGFLVAASMSSAVLGVDWRFVGNASALDYPQDLVVDGSGNAYLLTSFGPSQTDRDLMLVKLSPAGAVLWRRSYPAGPGIASGSLALGPGPVVYIAATEPGGAQKSNGVLYRISSAGLTQYRKVHNHPSNGNDGFTDVALDPAGNVYVAGFETAPVSGQNTFVAKYIPANGSLVWRNTYSSSGNRADLSASISIDRMGDVVATGGIAGLTSTDTQGFVRKLRPNGSQQWLRTLGAANTREFIEGSMNDGGLNPAFPLTAENGSGIMTTTLNKIRGTNGLDFFAPVRISGPTGGSIFGTGGNVDAFGNIIVTAATQVVGIGGITGSARIFKFNGNGVRLWDRTLSTQGKTVVPGMPLLDTSGNIFFVTQDVTPATQVGASFLNRYNAAGTQIYRYPLNGAVPATQRIYGLLRTPTGLLYAWGHGAPALGSPLVDTLVFRVSGG